MSRTRLRKALILLGVIAGTLALTGRNAAAAAEIQSFDPVEGTIGTRIAIHGSGFPDSKPKVALTRVDEATGKEVQGKTRVLSFSGSEITAEIKKASAGSYRLRLLLRGADPITAADPFHVRPPTFDALLSPGGGFPAVVEALQEVRIRGSHFGPRPKARAGGKRAKVTSVDPNELTFLVPRGLPVGLHDLEIANPVGSARIEEALRIISPPPPGSGFLEGWERASGTHGPGARIRGDAASWFLGDTVSSFPECGPSPHQAEIIPHNGGKALRLTAGDSQSECADNVWVDSRSVLSSGVSIAPGTRISFFAAGSLDDPEACSSPGPFQLILPCGDTIHLVILDDRGNQLVYIIARAPDEEPFEKRGYREVFLDSADGRYERDLYEDFLPIQGFGAAGSRLSQVVFGIGDHGSAIIDEISISGGE